VEVRTRNYSVKTRVAEPLDLPALRQHRGVSLREIADSTKISIRFLQAIEQGDLHQLPGGIYTKSYLRQYAREIGFEETELLAYFQAFTSESS
jgi:cytoskeleton protein RodZ